MTVAYTASDILLGNDIYTWSGMTLGDDGQPIGTTGSGDRTVQVRGTFGSGGTVVIEGTLDNVNWDTLRDPSGSTLSFTGSGIKAVLENVVAIRPRVTSGDISTLINVVIAIRKRYG